MLSTIIYVVYYISISNFKYYVDKYNLIFGHYFSVSEEVFNTESSFAHHIRDGLTSVRNRLIHSHRIASSISFQALSAQFLS